MTPLSIVYVFIDATNIMYGAMKYGWKIDFAKLLKYLQERYGARKVFYYSGLDTTNPKQVQFYTVLGKFGYEVRWVPLKIFADGRKKADVDSKMTFEMMLHFVKYDKAVILTGDGDYYWVLEYLKEQKHEVFLLAHAKNTAKELKKLFGSHFVDLQVIKHLIEKIKK